MNIQTITERVIDNKIKNIQMFIKFDKEVKEITERINELKARCSVGK